MNRVIVFVLTIFMTSCTTEEVKQREVNQREVKTLEIKQLKVEPLDVKQFEVKPQEVAKPAKISPGYLGRWEGKWDDTWGVRFTVNKTMDGDLEAIYEWEEHLGRPMQRRDLSARWSGDKLIFGGFIDLIPSNDDPNSATAVGHFARPREAKLTRTDFPDDLSAEEAKSQLAGRWEIVREVVTIRDNIETDLVRSLPQIFHKRLDIANGSAKSRFGDAVFDSSKNPKEITITNSAGKVALAGIYKISGDLLLIYSVNHPDGIRFQTEKIRPKAFGIPDKDHYTLQSFRRVKP